MKGLAELVLSFCDLAEAEGRLLRKNLLNAGTGCALTGAAILFIVVALCLVLCALYDWLLLFMPRPLTLLSLALASIVFAALLLWSARRCLPNPRKKTQKQVKAGKAKS